MPLVDMFAAFRRAAALARVDKADRPRAEAILERDGRVVFEELAAYRRWLDNPSSEPPLIARLAKIWPESFDLEQLADIAERARRMENLKRARRRPGLN